MIEGRAVDIAAANGEGDFLDEIGTDKMIEAKKGGKCPVVETLLTESGSWFGGVHSD
jgi:hypothetical protein